MLETKELKIYIKNLKKFWYSHTKVSRILDIDPWTATKIENWGTISRSTSERVINNYDSFVATFIKELK